MGKKSGFKWLGTTQLTAIIEEKYQENHPNSAKPEKKTQVNTAEQAEQSKENNVLLANCEMGDKNGWDDVPLLSEWASLRQRFEIQENRTFNKMFSQKTFFPMLISQSSLTQTPTHSLNDLCT